MDRMQERHREIEATVADIRDIEKREGVMREQDWFEDRFVDHIHFGCFRDELRPPQSLDDTHQKAASARRTLGASANASSATFARFSTPEWARERQGA